MFFLALSIAFVVATAQTNDTLKITLQQADSVFLRNNLLLLASQYGVQSQKALEIQAKLYPNPVFTAEFNAYDPQNNKEFHIGSTGEKIFAVEQLILLGGKRSAAIKIAKQNTQLAQLEFEDLLRNLQLQLHICFYTLQQQSFVLNKYQQQLTLLDTLIVIYETQAAKGNIPPKDVVRLKSAYFTINNDKAAFARQYAEENKKIQILLQQQAYIKPIISEASYSNFERQPLLDSMLTLALANRPDYKIADAEVMLAQYNLRAQKAQAVPDINLFSNYDQRGGAFNNQINAGISMPLPLWNRNQGNIKAAQWQQKSTQVLQQQKSIEINSEVREAFANMLRSIQEYKKVKQFYNDDFEIVAQGVSENFKNRNISIIEFMDFFEAYNESVAERQRVNIQLITGAEWVNYVTAAKVYKYEK